MKRINFIKTFSIGIFLFAFTLLYSNDSTEYIKKFVSGNLQDKVNVLKESSGSPAESFLNESAFDFISSYYTLLENEEDFSELVYNAVKTIPDNIKDKNISVLQRIYMYFDEPKIKIAVVEKLPSIKGNCIDIINLVNESVAKDLKNNTYKDSISFEPSVTALSSIAHSSSFQVLFSCYAANISEEINVLTETALKNMAEANRSQIVAIIANNEPKEKLLALRISEKKSQKNDFFSEEIAETALAIAINKGGDVQDIHEDLVKLQLEAMRIISKSSWTRATSLVVNYFELAKKQYSLGIITKENLIEVIQCLTNLATVESGQALSNYLATLNLESEKTGSYDKDIVLAVIHSLGVLGEKSAFDNLLYVISFSTYSEDIISASRDALSRLKW